MRTIMPAVCASGGQVGKFVIVDRIGRVISSEPMLQGSNGRATGQAGWFAYKRTSSDLLNTDAGRILKL